MAITSLGLSIFSTYTGTGADQARRDIQNLQQQYQALQTRMTALQRENSTLASSVSQLQASNARLRGEITALTGGFGNLGNATTSAANNMNNASSSATRLGSSITGATNSVRTLGNDANSTGSRINALGGNMNNARTSATSLGAAWVAAGNGARQMGDGAGGAGGQINSLGGSMGGAGDGATRMGDSFGGANRQVRSLSGSIGVLRTGMIALLPAMIPIAEVGLATAAGIGAMVIASGAAVGAYAAVGMAAGKAALLAREQGESMTVAQKAFVGAYDGMMDAWKRLVSETSKLTLQPQIEVMKGLTVAIGKLKPVIEALHPSIMKIAVALRGWLEGSGFERFINIVETEGVPAFAKLSNAGRDMLAVLGFAFRAFVPLIQPIAEWLEKGAASLRKWAEGGGFERFLERARENAPEVVEALKALWDAAQKIWDVLVKLSPVSLELATNLARIVSAIPTPVLVALVAGFLSLKMALGALLAPLMMFRLLMGPTGLFGVLSRILPIALKFSGILGVFVTVVTLAWKHSEMFRDAIKNLMDALQNVWAKFGPLVEKLKELHTTLEPLWKLIGIVAGFFLTQFVNALTAAVNVVAFLVTGLTTLVGWFNTGLQAIPGIWSAVWTGIQTVATTVWGALTVAWSGFTSGLTTAWTAVSGALTAAWNAVWQALSTAAQAVWQALQTAWSAFITALSTAWTAVSTALTTAWNAVWQALSTAAQAVWQALQVAWSAFINALSVAWTTVSTALTAAWNAVWQALSTAAQAVWQALQVAWTAFINALQTVWTTVSAALTAAWNAVWQALSTAAQAVWQALQTAWSAFITALQTVWTTVSTALSTAWNVFWQAIQTAAQAVWTALQTAWSAFWTAMTAAWDAFKNALTAAWQAFWQAIQTAASTVWTAIQTAWNAFFAAMTTAWNTFKDALTTAWQTFWTAIKTAAETVWNALKAAWDAFFSAMNTAWNTFKDALTTAWKTFWEAIQTAAKTVWDKIQELWGTFTKWIGDTWDKASDALKKAWEATWNAVSDIAKKVWSTIGGVIEKAINGVITIINKLIEGFNNITKFLDINVTIKEIGPVKFPGLADGGVVMFKYGGITGDPSKMMTPELFCKGGIPCGPKDMKGGGFIPGYAPGKDTVPAMLSRGEGVLTPEAVRGLGGAGFVNGANKQFAGHRGAGKGTPQFGMFGARVGQMEYASHPGKMKAFADGGMVGPAQSFAMGGITLAALARAGLAGVPITQPEFNPGVAASAGTHDGGGVVDLPANSAYLSKLLATGEWAAWMRGNGDGMSPHIHAVLMSHPQLSGAARAQVESFKKGGTGLGVGGGGGGGGPDIMAMILPHIGKILLNVFRGVSALQGISGPIADFFTGGGGGDAEPSTASGRTAEGGVVGPGGVITGGPSSTAPGIPVNKNESPLSAIASTVGLASQFISPAGAGSAAAAAGKVGIGVLKQGAQAGAGSAAGGMLKLLAQYVLPSLTKEHIATGLSDVEKLFDEFEGSGVGGNFGKMATGFGKKILVTAIPDFLMKKAAAAVPPAPPGVAGGGTGNVQQWAGLAAQALMRAGISSSQLGAFLALMQAESGGNPLAINRTDSNAKAGVPSQGLMQVIPPTFATHRDPSLPNNILDPLANMTAAARYIKSRYGGNVPGSPYAEGTTNATPGLHMVGEQGPELVMGPGFANFGGGETVLNAMDTQNALAGTGENQGLVQSFEGKSFEDIQRSAEAMAEAVDVAWTDVVAKGDESWATMTPTMAEMTAEFGTNIPAALEAMRLANETAYADMQVKSAAALEMMRATNQAVWTDMQVQSALQWALMRDTTYAEAELHQGTIMPQMAVTMQTASDLAWLTMQTNITAQWTLIRDNNFLPFEEHLGVTVPTAANLMNEQVTLAFQSMSDSIIAAMDAGIAKMDEFIAKAQEAIAVTAELVAAVAEAQEAMASMASMAAAGGGGGTAAGGTSGNVESWRALAAEAIAAGGLAPDQLDAFLALMQAESGGDPNAINNWDSNAAAGTPSIGLMQVIQPTFDAHNVTGGNIYDPYANMAASAAYIKSRYGGIVPGSPYATGTRSATPGIHLVGENGPELVGTDGAMFAQFAGGESVMAARPTMVLLTALQETITAIDAFIAKANEGIAQAKAITAAAQAAAAARAAMGAGGGGGAIGGSLADALACAGNPPIIQGPFSDGALSAGTHSGDGVVDVPIGWLSQMINCGFAAWERVGGSWAGNEHIHAVQIGNPGLSGPAQQQVQSWYAGGTGAIAHGTVSARRGWNLVGEKGPEMWRARGGEQVNSWKKTRELFHATAGGQGGGSHIVFEKDCFRFIFNGSVTPEALNRIEHDLVPKLRMAVQSGVGRGARPRG